MCVRVRRVEQRPAAARGADGCQALPGREPQGALVREIVTGRQAHSGHASSLIGFDGGVGPRAQGLGMIEQRRCARSRRSSRQHVGFAEVRSAPCRSSDGAAGAAWTAGARRRATGRSVEAKVVVDPTGRRRGRRPGGRRGVRRLGREPSGRREAAHSGACGGAWPSNMDPARDRGGAPEERRELVAQSVEREEVGRVIETGDGIARVAGPAARDGERAAWRLSGRTCSAWPSTWTRPRSAASSSASAARASRRATRVEQAGRILAVPVGDGFLGRVVDGLGRPLDGTGAIAVHGDAAPWRCRPPNVVRAPRA